jgi:LPS O-antigen subunit length determinant protein (WzzB/FepE family)
MKMILGIIIGGAIGFGIGLTSATLNEMEKK